MTTTCRIFLLRPRDILSDVDYSMYAKFFKGHHEAVVLRSGMGWFYPLTLSYSPLENIGVIIQIVGTQISLSLNITGSLLRNELQLRSFLPCVHFSLKVSLCLVVGVVM